MLKILFLMLMVLVAVALLNNRSAVAVPVVPHCAPLVAQQEKVVPVEPPLGDLPIVVDALLQPRARRILINFGHNCCEQARLKNCETGLKLAGFDVCYSYTMQDVDSHFYEEHKSAFGSPSCINRYNLKHSYVLDILEQPRGAGYWLWKPYLLFKTMRQAQEGDIIFYCDAGAYFLRNVTPLIELADKEEIVTFQIFENTYIESSFTKRDTFRLLNADNSTFSKTP